MNVIGEILLSYLLGSIPTGFLLGKWLKGVDIRQHGSGNPGATNVFRVVGVGAGIATLLIDFAKGFLPTWLALHILNQDLRIAGLIGLAAIAGHNWTIFLKFKGGKGVITSAGVFMAILPLPTGIAISVFVAMLFISRYVSLSSMVSAASLPATLWWQNYSPSFILFSGGCASLIIFLHRKNIARLCNGEEPKAF